MIICISRLIEIGHQILGLVSYFFVFFFDPKATTSITLKKFNEKLKIGTKYD